MEKLEEEYIESFYGQVNGIEKEFNIYQKKIEEKFQAINAVTKKYKNKLEEYKKYLKEENAHTELKNEKYNEIKALSLAFKNLIRKLYEENDDIQTMLETIQKNNDTLFFQVNTYIDTNINNIPNTQPGIRKFKSKLELYTGSMLYEEPSYIVNYPGMKGGILVGFKNGTFTLGKLLNKTIGLYSMVKLNHGEIHSMLVLKGQYCPGFFLMCSEIKKQSQ